jgi:hypothetical protein
MCSNRHVLHDSHRQDQNYSGIRCPRRIDSKSTRVWHICLWGCKFITACLATTLTEFAQFIESIGIQSIELPLIITSLAKISKPSLQLQAFVNGDINSTALETDTRSTEKQAVKNDFLHETVNRLPSNFATLPMATYKPARNEIQRSNSPQTEEIDGWVTRTHEESSRRQFDTNSPDEPYLRFEIETPAVKELVFDLWSHDQGISYLCIYT